MMNWLRRLFGKGDGEEAAKTPVPNDADAAIAAAIAASIAASEANDGAIVAAITAAITAMRAEEGYTGGFRVVCFKRANTLKRRK